MKIALIVISVLMLAGVAVFFILGLVSQSGETSGIVEGKLAKCPDRPNCICTEFEADPGHYVTPMVFSERNAADTLSGLKSIVREMGGSIQVENDNYLAVTFTSSIFRFVDDLEIRIDTDHKMIHLRSASRVGYSDRGVNKQRVGQFKKLFGMKAG